MQHGRPITHKSHPHHDVMHPVAKRTTQQVPVCHEKPELEQIRLSVLACRRKQKVTPKDSAAQPLRLLPWPNAHVNNRSSQHVRSNHIADMPGTARPHPQCCRIVPADWPTALLGHYVCHATTWLLVFFFQLNGVGAFAVQPSLLIRSDPVGTESWQIINCHF